MSTGDLLIVWTGKLVQVIFAGVQMETDFKVIVCRGRENKKGVMISYGNKIVKYHFEGLPIILPTF